MEQKDIGMLVKELARVSGINCKQDFKCGTLPIQNLCKVNGFGDKYQCVEKKPRCNQALDYYGSFYLCKCPVRLYIQKEIIEKKV